MNKANAVNKYSIFDYLEYIKNSSEISMEKFKDYTIDDYCADITNKGIKNTCDSICNYVLTYGENENLLKASNFGEMYETALALVNKQQKKSCGQYYTPHDVANVMSKWFDRLKGENICDVACGTGNLILSYFDFIGRDKTIEILSSGRLYLYDIDSLALKICKTSILSIYGQEYENKIHAIVGDFLDKDIVLPPNCKVIANPPYANLSSFDSAWNKTNILIESKEYYSAFMEKIIDQSSASVIITPYSFIGGTKFYLLRQLMNKYNGFIVSFDNVPGNIFKGQKYGVFNTNTSNSVRAAITVVENKQDIFGFKLSPLIRFKSEERRNLLKCEILESFIYDKYQLVDTENSMYFKCDKRLGNIFRLWKTNSNDILKNYVKEKGKYILSMPNTCHWWIKKINFLQVTL